MTTNKLGLLAAGALLLGAAACNQPAEGVEGNIQFTPDNCVYGDLDGCDFEDSVGVGGKINVYIDGLNGFPTAGVDLDTSDPNVFTLTPVASTSGRPTWELLATGPGVARIIAYDAQDVEVDFLEVAAQEITGLTMVNFVGDAVGPSASTDINIEEVWTINANQQVSFYVRATIGDGAPTMGRFTYGSAIDLDLDAALTAASDPGSGYIDFSVPAGAYEATFGTEQVQLDVQFVAQ